MYITARICFDFLTNKLRTSLALKGPLLANHERPIMNIDTALVSECPPPRLQTPRCITVGELEQMVPNRSVCSGTGTNFHCRKSLRIVTKSETRPGTD